MNDGEALNFGTPHMEHDPRYDRADEFMEVVMGHWNTWEDDALVLDKATASSRIPTRCTGWTIRAGISVRVGRSACLGRRRVIRC